MASLSSLDVSSQCSQLEAQLDLYEIMFSAAKPMALKAIVFLNVPDILAIHGNGNPLSVEEIAAHISASTTKPAHTNYLSRILRFLASFNVFNEETTVSSDGTTQFKYGLTNISKFLVKHENEYCIAPLLLVPNQKAILDGYQHLHESVIEGCHAFNRANGMSLWEYSSNNPEANTIFNEGMVSHTRAVMASLLKIYDGFKNVKSVVDVGGGVGSALALILSQHPHLHGINLDLPHVIKASSPIQGVEHVEGNMFEEIPSADIVFMKSILHNWDDEQCVKVLMKSYEAIPGNGKVLIVDAVIDVNEARKRQCVLLFDMVMMASILGGRERTEEEFKSLFLKAGFTSYTISNLSCLEALIEVYK